MSVKVKRVYEPPEAGDGVRVLVDRLWPRGLKKEAAALDLWLKDVAPSDELRRWYGHEPSRWEEFRRRYRAELADREDALAPLRARLATGETLSLLFGARDESRNNAVVLAEYLGEAASSKK